MGIASGNCLVRHGRPTPLIIAVGTSALAVMLRQTIRLDQVVMLAVIPGVVAYFLLPLWLSEVLPQVIQTASR